MEGIIAYWVKNGISIGKQDCIELENLSVPPVTNLWDIFRINCIKEDFLPRIRKQIRRHQKELHCLICTCKNAYVNGYPKIENNL